MGRYVRSHADGYAVGAVNEHIGEARGKHGGLHARIVERGIEIDGLLVEIAQHLRRKFGEPRLRIPHRRGRVSVDGTEVAVPLYEREIYRKVLREPDEGVVYRRIAVRVVFTEAVADYARAFTERFIVVEPEFVHGI